MTDAPIFIVGTPRSGTTLTAQVLGRHSAIYMPTETTFMQTVYERRREIGDPAVDPNARAAILGYLKIIYCGANERHQAFMARLWSESDLEERLLATTSYRDAFATLIQAQMEARGKRRWGNHHPSDLFELEQLLTLFPDAKVIVCVRNVFDFLISYRDKWKRSQRLGREANAARLRKLYHPVITSLLWKGSMRRADAALRRWGDRLFLNRYEDMVSAPEAQARKLCEFVGEAFEPGMVEVHLNNSSQEVAEAGIFTASVGRWRGRLGEAEAFVAQTVCRAELRRFGYVPEALKPNLLEVGGYFVGAPFRGLQAVVVNRGRGGPILPYMAKRIRSIMPGAVDRNASVKDQTL